MLAILPRRIRNKSHWSQRREPGIAIASPMLTSQVTCVVVQPSNQTAWRRHMFITPSSHHHTYAPSLLRPQSHCPRQNEHNFGVIPDQKLGEPRTLERISRHLEPTLCCMQCCKRQDNEEFDVPGIKLDFISLGAHRYRWR